jgi:hypothetical protein
MNSHLVHPMMKSLACLAFMTSLAPRLWAKPPKEIPYQSVTFFPLKGTYVFRVEGMMDDKTFKHSIDTVELIPIKEKHGTFKLDRVQDSRSVRFYKRDGSYVDGGFGSMGNSTETLQSYSVELVEKLFERTEPQGGVPSSGTLVPGEGSGKP